MRLFYLLFLTIPFCTNRHEVLTPLEKNKYSKVTSYNELKNFVKEVDAINDLICVDSIGKTIEGRNLFAIKFSNSEFGTDSSKIKILILAQQHGNEQSGKEGALLLVKELLKPEYQYLFNKIDLAIIPQANPDGSEKNKRRNVNSTDLNRNHLVLTEPEVISIHQFFDKYHFEVTMDVHEYSPYPEEDEKVKFIKTIDEQIGLLTNIDVSEEIRAMSKDEFLPYIKKFFAEKGFSSFIYTPGGPPYSNFVRYSTFDINDGRQSFGIQNTFSIIQEGLNGKDNLIDNIERRTIGQMTGMLGLLNFSYTNCEKIKQVVSRNRETLIKPKTNSMVTIQFEHSSIGTKLELPMFSLLSKKDTTIIVDDFRPEVKSIYDVTKPAGYLVPKNLKEFVEWLSRHNIDTSNINNISKYSIEQYKINSIDSIDFEGDKIANPNISVFKNDNSIDKTSYIFVPTNQLKGNMIVLALEPKSMLGLVNYSPFNAYMRSNTFYPILRVIEK